MKNLKKKFHMSSYKPHMYMILLTTIALLLELVVIFTTPDGQFPVWQKVEILMQRIILPAELTLALIHCRRIKDAKLNTFLTHTLRIISVTMLTCVAYVILNKSDAAIELTSYIIGGAITNTCTIIIVQIILNYPKK